jgi:hypothetical protein
MNADRRLSSTSPVSYVEPAGVFAVLLLAVFHAACGDLGDLADPDTGLILTCKPWYVARKPSCYATRPALDRNLGSQRYDLNRSNQISFASCGGRYEIHFGERSETAATVGVCHVLRARPRKLSAGYRDAADLLRLRLLRQAAGASGLDDRELRKGVVIAVTSL